ncbi:MAG TPA: hypothetical protein VGE13_01435 [Candidatus Saccharimonadales bacterium]
MEPRSSEHLPSPIEYTPQVSNTQEAQPDARYERRESTVERAGEQVHQVTQVQAQPPAPIVQLPTPVQATDDNTQVVVDDTPQVAADDDLIEKEWVDKAKKVVAETKDDPYERERAVGRLQGEYLRKRYGKELGSESA